MVKILPWERGKVQLVKVFCKHGGDCEHSVHIILDPLAAAAQISIYLESNHFML